MTIEEISHYTVGGFIFRMYITVLFFWIGFKILVGLAVGPSSDFHLSFIFALGCMGWSLYLLFNFLTNKITNEIWEKWYVGGIFFVGLVVVAYLSAIFAVGRILPFSFDSIGLGMKIMFD